jgi:hypothetical protein
MPTIDVSVTILNGVSDTVSTDFQRAEKVFHAVPLKFRVTKFTLDKSQSQAILGTDGKLATTGGQKKFTHDLPAGAARKKPVPIDVEDPKGSFTSEVWTAIQNWTDLGGLHVFYVNDFDPPSAEGGFCLRAGDMIDPIIFVSQPANIDLLQTTRSTRGVLEHEIGHAFGLPDTQTVKKLMSGIVGAEAGTFLTQDELATIKASRLLGLAATAATP